MWYPRAFAPPLMLFRPPPPSPEYARAETAAELTAGFAAILFGGKGPTSGGPVGPETKVPDARACRNACHARPLTVALDLLSTGSKGSQASKGGAAPTCSRARSSKRRPRSQRLASNRTRTLGPTTLRFSSTWFKITPQGMQHVVERHTYSGIADYANKSKFTSAENLQALIEGSSQQPMARQPNGNYARTFNVPNRTVGLDCTTGNQTSTVTVITKPDGTLVTAFPGRP